jgi:hypothetical protein
MSILTSEKKKFSPYFNHYQGLNLNTRISCRESEKCAQQILDATEVNGQNSFAKPNKVKNMSPCTQIVEENPKIKAHINVRTREISKIAEKTMNTKRSISPFVDQRSHPSSASSTFEVKLRRTRSKSDTFIPTARMVLPNATNVLKPLSTPLKQCEQSEMRKIGLAPKFDKGHPICSIKRTDVIDSFRFFYADDFVDNPSAPAITINGIPFVFPNVTDLTDADRKKALFAELIRELNSAVKVAEIKNQDEQVHLLFNTALSRQEMQSLTSLLASLMKFYSQGNNRAALILESLQFESCSQKFRDWLQKNLASMLKNEDSAALIVQAYEKTRWLTICRRYIPCFRVLQSLSISAYAHAHTLLQKCYPELTHLDHARPRFKHFPTEPTRFLIKIDAGSKIFSVTQIKPHRLIQGNTGKMIHIGNAQIYWQIRGGLASNFFSANFWHDEPSFSPDAPSDLRLKVQTYLNDGI